MSTRVPIRARALRCKGGAVRGATAGAFAAPTASATRVSGILYDLDPQSRDRALFGANSIDQSVQDTANLRLGYAISPTQEIEGRLSWWHDDSSVRASTYLRDALGNPVWGGVVTDGVRQFTLTPDAFAPSLRDEVHRQLGVTWKTKYAKGWNASVVATDYRIISDAARQANLAQPQADLGLVMRLELPLRDGVTKVGLAGIGETSGRQLHAFPGSDRRAVRGGHAHAALRIQHPDIPPRGHTQPIQPPAKPAGTCPDRRHLSLIHISEPTRPY